MQNNTIKHIIFDLSEVLLTGIKDTGLALALKHKLEKSLSHSVGWTHLKTPLLVPLVEEFFHGNVSEDEYIKEILDLYPQIGTEEWLKNHIRENFIEVEGTRDIIIELKKLGYTLTILSVHAKEWIEYCEEKFNFHDLFEFQCYSYDYKVSKPHRDSFTMSLKQIDAKPNECLFIDDSEKNIAAAESLGIRSILFTDAISLKEDLSKILSDFNV